MQWAFPLRESSPYNPTAPILDQATIDTFKNSPELQKKLLTMFKRTLKFYGLMMTETGEITQGPNFNERARNSWLKTRDHNHQRITRILKCLNLLQANATPNNSWSEAFFRCLKKLQRENNGVIDEKNFKFWQDLYPDI